MNIQLEQRLIAKNAALEKELDAKNRELEIEASLERVRVKAMAMQESDELTGLIAKVYEELKKLDFVLTRAMIWIFNPVDLSYQNWMANRETGASPGSYLVKYNESPSYLARLKGWKGRIAKWEYVLSGEDKRAWDQFLFNETGLSGLPDVVKEGMKESERIILNASFSNFGGLAVSGLEPLPDEQMDILYRFGKVFDLTYTRFFDLQKAEAQAREAQIELALERVRARTMAMQHSNELAETASLLFKQIADLGTRQWASGFVIRQADDVSATAWMSNPDGSVANPFTTPDTEDPFHQQIYEATQSGKDLFVMESDGKELEETYKYMFTIPDAKKYFDAIISIGFQIPTFQITHCAFFSQGFLMFITYEPVPEMWDIFKRFAKVFEQTYTRFLDLQKAEAQAREAQIEAALERVRSKTMGMHKSADLLEVISVLSEQFLLLGFKIHSANFNTSYRQKDWNLWLYNPGTPMYPDQIHIPYLDNPFFNRTLESLANGADFTAFVFTKEEKDGFRDHLYSTTIAKNASEERKRFSYGAPGFAWSTVYLKNTALTIANYDAEPYTEEQNAILRKFGNVFEQSYTRFLDLQKAEAQARETQIELGLERVRAKAMAMQSSEDVGSATAIVFNEITLLRVETMRCGITIIHPDKTADVWAATTTNEGKEMKGVGSINFNEHPLWVGLFDAWQDKKENFSYHLKGDDLKTYYKALANSPNYSASYLKKDELPEHFFYASFFEEGAVFTFSLQPHDEENQKILKKFTAVFSLTFRRYQDLKQAEAQTREAKIEASLERVRGKAMSMHSSRDLADTIEVFYHEVESLSITPRRCGVGLMDKETHFAELSTMNTTELGESIEIIGKLKMEGHPVLEGVYDNWVLQKEYHPVLRGDEIKQYYQLIRPQIAYPDYPTDMTQYGYFFFFNEGGVYAWTEKELSEDELKIYRRFTSVLSLTYKRYKDLKDAEA
ncbi:MAG TPA: hypothetical protein VMU83_23555, partial [Hanamia sp.]|nr:hypothetical protein [Hanamia sp.]